MNESTEEGKTFFLLINSFDKGTIYTLIDSTKVFDVIFSWDCLGAISKSDLQFRNRYLCLGTRRQARVSSPFVQEKRSHHFALRDTRLDVIAAEALNIKQNEAYLVLPLYLVCLLSPA